MCSAKKTPTPTPSRTKRWIGEHKMKTLKFAPHLVEKIISGEKTITWRLFDDKDLQEGDDLIFVNKETGEQFGTATITSLKIKTLGTLEADDWMGHVNFSIDTIVGYIASCIPAKILPTNHTISLMPRT
ncbi:MAG: hypothetical protein B7X03_00755 [Parcubacteria group bacterium 21-58-10]|nr:MAG: hypothetical protein B7X03_00755 [Parcubacteria group bacterium 21-58-10]